MSNITTSIKHLSLTNPLMNASGPRSTSGNEIQDILNSTAAAVVTKSMTAKRSSGNSTPKYFCDGFGNTINSNGLENLGIENYLKILDNLSNPYKKPVFASLAASSAKNSLVMLEKLLDSDGIDGIEINPSCPNLKNKSILANDIDTLESFVGLCMSAKAIKKSTKLVGFKLPMYTDKIVLREVSDIMMKKGVDFISVMNSVPFALEIDIDTCETIIHPNSGVGGLGGPRILPIALGQTWLHYQVLGDSVPIIGVGGIQTAEDVLKYILCGASMVQIGSVFSQVGVSIFDTLTNDLHQLLDQKGIEDIAQIRGTLTITQSKGRLL